MFYLITPENRGEFTNELKQMHKLRHRIFIEHLKWPLGPIKSVNGMEFDQFDTLNTCYVIRKNSKGVVDACARIIPTSLPNLLCDVFPELIKFQDFPRNETVWEISRFCSDNSTAPRNIVGLLVAAMLKFGVSINMKHYVSMSDIRIEPLLRRAGWKPERLGETMNTGTDTAAGEIYEVSLEVLQNVCRKSCVDEELLKNIPDYSYEKVKAA